MVTDLFPQVSPLQVAPVPGSVDPNPFHVCEHTWLVRAMFTDHPVPVWRFVAAADPVMLDRPDGRLDFVWSDVVVSGGAWPSIGEALHTYREGGVWFCHCLPGTDPDPTVTPSGGAS